MKVKGCLKHQIEFANSEDKFTAIVGGFRSGKTMGILYRYMKLSAKRKGKVKLLVVAPTYRLLKDVDIPLFLDYFEKKGIRCSFSADNMSLKVHDYVKGTVMFRNGENPRRLVGFEVTDFIIDEFDVILPKNQKDLWVKCLARISGAKNSTGAVVTTPEGFRYTYQLFQVDKIGKLIKASTRDNFYLPDDYIPTLERTYDPLLVKQYIEGEFVNIKNFPAYYAFDREFLVDDYTPTQNHFYIGMDFNVNPMTAVVGELDNEGDLIIFKEYYMKNSNTFQMVQKIIDDFGNYKLTCCPDMTGRSRKTSATMTDIQIIQKADIEILGINNPRERDRINTFNNAIAKGRVFITSNCTSLIRDLEQVTVDEYGIIDKSDPNLTHISDAAGYLVYRLLPMREQRKITVSSM